MKIGKFLKKITAYILSVCMIASVAGFLGITESQAAVMVPSIESSVILDEHENNRPDGFVVEEPQEEQVTAPSSVISMGLQVVQEGANSAVLNWEGEPVEAVYKICRTTSGKDNFVQIGTVNGNQGQQTYMDTAAVPGKVYRYKVLEYVDGELTEESQIVSCMPVLKSPKGIAISGISANKVKVSWNSVKHASGYYVYRSTNKNSGYTKVATVSSDKGNYTDGTLVNGYAYYYRVGAYLSENQLANSDYSGIVAYYMKPVAPIVTGEYQKGEIRLSWARPTGGETFTVYRASENGSYTKIGTSTGLSYYDEDVKLGETYLYKVVASYTKDGKTVSSDYSAACSVYASGIDPNKPMIALTFDDGPGPHTKAIIDCLVKHNARATFFVIGQQVSAYKSVVKAAFDAGCEIGNHSWSHPQLSSSNVTTQISKTDEAVKNAIGQYTKIYRAPYGYTNSTIRSKVSKPHIFWSVDTLDWKTKSKSATVNHVLKNVKDGDIILMHDIHKPTMQAALELIPELQKRGYQLVTVSELAEYRGVKMKNGTTYYSFR